MRSGARSVDVGLVVTGPGDRDAGESRARGPFGPLEMLDEVQRQALDAAMRVAGELGALGGQMGDGAWFGNAFARASGKASGAHDQSTAPPFDVGRLRGDVVRAAETFSELMRSMLDVGFDAMDELARRPAPRPSARASAGEVARVECVVRNDQGAAAIGRPRLLALTSGTGIALDETVTIHPEVLSLEAHERATIELEVRVPSRAMPGRYHGLLLVAGLADVATAVTVEVGEPECAGRDDD